MGKRQAYTIGIMGAGPGCGVTHFTLLFANYLAAVEWKRTAVLEWNNHHELKELISVCTGAEAKAKPASILGVDYFYDGGAEELAWCLDKEYECILMDFGCVRDGKKAEFLQCGQKLFLGAFNEWKLKSLIDQKDWMGKGKESWNYLSVFGGDEAKREFKRRFGLPFLSIPYAPDAFIIERDMAVFLRKIWRDKSWIGKKS